MARNQQSQFPDDSPEDAVPMNTQGIQRQTTNAQTGQSALTRAKGTPKVNAARPAGGNPYKSGEDSWGDHAGLLGF